MFKRAQAFDLTKMVAPVVARYVANHGVDTEVLPNLIQLMAQSLTMLSHEESKGLSPVTVFAVAVEDSLQPDILFILKMSVA